MPDRPQREERERLERQRLELLNSFSGDPWRDGQVRDRIAEIDRQLQWHYHHDNPVQ